MGLLDRLLGRPQRPASLEQALLRFNTEKTAQTQNAALAMLLESRLFVPSQREVTEAMGSLAFIVRDTPGGPAIVAFTDAALLDAARAQELGAKAGYELDARWVLSNLSDDVGLWLNPGQPSGLLLPAAGLAAFRRAHLKP